MFHAPVSKNATLFLALGSGGDSVRDLMSGNLSGGSSICEVGSDPRLGFNPRKLQRQKQKFKFDLKNATRSEKRYFAQQRGGGKDFRVR